MILPQTYLQSLILMIASLICLGSWAVTYKLAGKWRFELYYIDFAIGVAFAAVIYAATVGSLGFDSLGFTDDLFHAGKRQWMFAILAGIVFNLGNMLMVGAMSVSGMSVALPTGVGISLVIGSGLTGVIRRESDPMYLFTGMAVMLAAIVLVWVAYASRVGERAQAIIEEARQANRKVRVPGAAKGLILAILGGLVMAAHVPLLGMARTSEIGLGPYSGTFMFSMGLFVSTLIFTVFFANLPVEGEPLEITKYFRGTIKGHLVGILGGILWCTGMLAAWLPSAAEEPAHITAVAFRALTFGVPVVAALWGLIVLGEFRGASSRAKLLAGLMVVLLAAGVALVSLAPMFLKTVPA